MRFSNAQLGLLVLCLSLVGADAVAGGNLGEYQRISSVSLGYDLRYRVYRPVETTDDDSLPTLYVTDGQWYLQYGNLVAVLDRMIDEGAIRKVLVIFLDSRNPDDPGDNRRNTEFMCNSDFAAFFATELIPQINAQNPVSLSRNDRVILGVSFGGLNSACFGLMLPDLFGGIAMQSPASSDHVDVVRALYEEKEVLPLKFFLSAGTDNDNLAAARRLKRVLTRKGYDLTFKKVRGGHDWRNWGSHLDDVLATFFATVR